MGDRDLEQLQQNSKPIGYGEGCHRPGSGRAADATSHVARRPSSRGGGGQPGNISLSRADHTYFMSERTSRRLRAPSSLVQRLSEHIGHTLHKIRMDSRKRGKRRRLSHFLIHLEQRPRVSARSRCIPPPDHRLPAQGVPGRQAHAGTQKTALRRKAHPGAPTNVQRMILAAVIPRVQTGAARTPWTCVRFSAR